MVVSARRICLIAILILSVSLAYAQDTRVMASVNKYTIQQSEPLQFTLKIISSDRINVSEPQAPVVEGLRFQNMVSSSSSSTSIVNFKARTEYSRSYTYIYYPRRTGKMTIPGVSLRIGNTSYATQAINIEVVEDRIAPAQPTPPRSAFDPFGIFSDEDQHRRDGKTLLLCLPESQDVFRGEPAIVSYYLYTNQNVRSFNLESERDFDGYGKAPFEQPTVLNYEDIQYQGERFKRALLKRIALFPQRSGQLRAPQMSGTMRLYDYGYSSRGIQSTIATINVKNPPAGAPSTYTGAIGSFQISESYSTSEINLGDAITYTMQIRGRGNFNQFTAPAYPKNKSYQVSSPQAQDKLKAGIDGSRTIQYTLIMQETGEITLPGIDFSWLDAESGSYQSFRSSPRTVKVKPSNVLSYFSDFLASDKKMQMNPLIELESYPAHRVLFSSIWYWAIVGLILVSLMVSALFAYERNLHLLNPERYKEKSSARILSRFLHESNAAAQSGSVEFYPLAETGLLRYLAQKYKISTGLSTAELMEELAQTDLPGDLLAELTAFLDTCHEARFMPGGARKEAIATDLARLHSLINKLGKLRKGKK